MDLVAREIQQYSIEHRTKFNPKKCKEMWINFMSNPNIVRRDIVVNGLHM